MSTSPAMPLAAALESCARELATLGETCAGLQDTLSPLLLRSSDVEQAQALDLVTQSLDALAGYIAALSAHAPAGVEVDTGSAVAGVKLADLAARLTGRGATPAAEEAGELDMFGAC